MKADVWSPSFKLKNGEGGYLEQSNADVPDNLKIGDIMYMYGRFKCEVTNIYILYGSLTIQVKVIDNI